MPALIEQNDTVPLLNGMERRSHSLMDVFIRMGKDRKCNHENVNCYVTKETRQENKNCYEFDQFCRDVSALSLQREIISQKVF